MAKESMRLVRADRSDNQRLCQFFNSVPLPGEIDLQFERDHFFAPYQIFSDDRNTYMLLNERNEVEALASLAFREAYLGDRIQTIGYASDLRVANSRRAILNWAQHFLPLLEEEKRHRECRYVFSVVAQMQRQAYNAFIRPRLTRRSLPRYHLYRAYRLITIHGMLPFAPKPLRTIFIRKGTLQDLTAISYYIAEKSKGSLLRLHPSAELIHDSILRWPGIRPEDFILAFDFHRNLIGCVAPWDMQATQRVRALSYHKRAKVLYDSVRALSLLRITHGLSRPGELLHFYYLSHLYADNPDVFYSLIYTAYNSVSRQHFLVYPHFDAELIATPSKAMITANIKCGLYMIQAPQEVPPDFITWTRQETPPEFELPFF